MNRTFRYWLLFAVSIMVCSRPLTLTAQDATDDDAVQEIRGILESIYPYVPTTEVKTEIDLFGSTSMDRLAHGWALGFQKFHPEAKVRISAEGSETVFDRIAQSPTSIAMLSRPVSPADLRRLKEQGMKQPVAIMVAREALGVFVHHACPLESIDYEALVRLFCSPEDSDELTWGEAGVEGEYQSKPVVTVGRGTKSGTRTYIEQYLFPNHAMRSLTTEAATNFELVSEVAKNPLAIGISGMRCGGHSAKLLNLKSNRRVIPTDDRSLLLGQYPLMRPFCLVIDIGQKEGVSVGNREFARYAITQAGQTEAVLAGLFPIDPQILRAQEVKIGFETSVVPSPAETQDAKEPATSENK